ncbi:uncharacterized protein [Cicer arietinum]|uniref:Uncharacterized protein LOC101495448 n=1 Tax=Cicer arietinum TaxID=3827 RepID=A0A1S2Y296_CICAR|nr:uncharacterized protein LOC101495448 [Cicer arietinum]
MSNKVVLRPAGSSNHRRQPLLQQSQSLSKAATHIGEVVGGTAAVCCCCPCALANIVYLAIYKVPATLCIRALKMRKQRRRRRLQTSAEGVFPQKRRCTCGCCDDVGFRVHPTCGDDDVIGGVKSQSMGVEEELEDKDAMELEKEMWERFYGTGFWRSSSQRQKESLSFSSSTSSQSQQWVLTATISAPNLHVRNVSSTL